MKVINTRTSKFEWLKCAQEIPSVQVTQNIEKLG